MARRLALLFPLLLGVSSLAFSAGISANSTTTAEECSELGFTGVALCSDCDRFEATVHDPGEGPGASALQNFLPSPQVSSCRSKRASHARSGAARTL